MGGDVVLEVEHLSKVYQFGQIGYGTLYRDLQSWWARVRDREDPNARIHERRMDDQTVYRTDAKQSNERFLALDDVSFQVRRGEALGIIGRNGAGKSTLLKILSRVTAPTQGRVRIRGRVASLLEVGTGFHPELSGRENIYLNGAILGMTRAEINRKIDAIVDFAEIGPFLDTPVKRYSSGMYVRLAFAVAAHLEPEILILDEVLAVGDAKFVKKCMEKIESARHDGRTIIFVSHGMSSVLQLCPKAMMLENGKVVASGPSAEVVRKYTGELVTGNYAERKWADDPQAPSFESGAVRLLSVKAKGADGSVRGTYGIGDMIDIEMTFRVLQPTWRLSAHVYLEVLGGPRLLVSMDNYRFEKDAGPRPAGLYVERCRIPAHFLGEGSYTVEALVCVNPMAQENLAVRDAVIFSVAEDNSKSFGRSDWTREWPAALTRPDLEWQVDYTPDR